MLWPLHGNKAVKKLSTADSASLLALNDVKIHRGRGFGQAILLVTVPTKFIEVKASSSGHSRVAGGTLLDTVPEGAATRQGVEQTSRTLLFTHMHTHRQA